MAEARQSRAPVGFLRSGERPRVVVHCLEFRRADLYPDEPRRRRLDEQWESAGCRMTTAEQAFGLRSFRRSGGLTMLAAWMVVTLKECGP
jgi:hypothetical protein